MNNREIAARAVHQREHGQEPRPQHPGEAAAPLPHGGRHVCRPREAARPPLSDDPVGGPWLSSVRDDADPVARPGAPDRAGRPGVPRPASTRRPTMRTLDPHRRAHRRAPGRLGQRARARPPDAALLADGSLRRRPARAGGLGPGAASAGRVLGARPGLDAGRPVAGHAVPDGDLPGRARQVGVHGRPDPGAGGARRRAPAGAGHRPRPRRRVQRPAHQGALGLELVGGPQGARLPVPGR